MIPLNSPAVFPEVLSPDKYTFLPHVQLLLATIINTQKLGPRVNKGHLQKACG